MTTNKLLHFSNSEKCCILIGICLGIILTFLILLLYIVLPTISPVQQAGLCGFSCGLGIMWCLTKITWEEYDDNE